MFDRSRHSAAAKRLTKSGLWGRFLLGEGVNFPQKEKTKCLNTPSSPNISLFPPYFWDFPR